MQWAEGEEAELLSGCLFTEETVAKGKGNRRGVKRRYETVTEKSESE